MAEGADDSANPAESRPDSADSPELAPTDQPLATQAAQAVTDVVSSETAPAVAETTTDDHGDGTEMSAAHEPLGARTPLLFLTVLIVSTSGLVYELLAGAYSSYVLGDSVRQFSTTIGVYLFAMGIGSFLSRYVKRDVGRRFVEVELCAALVGGGSVPLLQVGAAFSSGFTPLLYGTIIAIGTLVGLEIPLLMRLLKEELDFEELIAKVLTFDYIGALFGSILFALVFVPRLGLVRTSLLFGLLNCGVALMGTYILAHLLAPRMRVRLRVLGGVLAAGLLAAFIYAPELTAYTEQALYTNPIVHAEQTPYQRIVMTRGRRGTQLFLNGNLQFSTLDEYRYHEALVHPAFSASERDGRVLILGGGDGLALREVLRHRGVERVVMVDLDPAVTRLAREHVVLRDLNRRSMEDPRLTLVNDDAMVWLDVRADRPDAERFDVVIIDFPDPNNFALGKLYSRRFYRLLQTALAPGAAVVVQSTSPLYARRSFWCIDATMREAGFDTHAYHVTVPSFGEWGYVLAKLEPFSPPTEVTTGEPLEGLRYLDDATLASLFVFSRDMSRVETETNRLNNQMLVRYYEREWSRIE